MEASDADRSGVRSVRRALDILSALDAEHPVLTLKDSARLTGLPKTTALRLLQTLEAAGILWGGEGHYAPGPALLRLARFASDAWLLPPAAQGIIAHAAEETGETVNIYVRKGIRRVCIAQAQGSHSLRHVVRVGDELPLWAGASAKILLATVDESFWSAVAEDSPYGPAHVERIAEWVEGVKRNGWAVSHAERDDLVSAVSVSLGPFGGGSVVLALSISGPTTRFGEERVEQFVEILRDSVKAFEDVMAGSTKDEALGITRLLER